MIRVGGQVVRRPTQLTVVVVAERHDCAIGPHHQAEAVAGGDCLHPRRAEDEHHRRYRVGRARSEVRQRAQLIVPIVAEGPNDAIRVQCQAVVVARCDGDDPRQAGNHRRHRVGVVGPIVRRAAQLAIAVVAEGPDRAIRTQRQAMARPRRHGDDPRQPRHPPRHRRRALRMTQLPKAVVAERPDAPIRTHHQRVVVTGGDQPRAAHRGHIGRSCRSSLDMQSKIHHRRDRDTDHYHGAHSSAHPPPPISSRGKHCWSLGA